MKKKTRRFDEGGFLTKQGKNENISDETRERARKFVEDASEESTAPKATSKASTPTVKASSSSSKAESKPAPKAESKSAAKSSSEWDSDSKIKPVPEAPRKAETKEENKTRMEGLTKKQALEDVSPEDYVPGPGMLKGMLKRGVKSGLKTIEQKALTNNPTKKIGLDKDTYKSTAEKAREARQSSRMSKMREENADAGPAGRARASGSTNDMGGTFSDYELRSDFKKGGFVHHNDRVKKHAAGFKHHDDHVKSMCMGGKTRAK